METVAKVIQKVNGAEIKATEVKGNLLGPYIGGSPTSTTDTNMIDDEFYLDGQNQLTEVTVLRFKMPYDCYVIAHAVKLETQRTAGTIDLKIAKNETLLTNTALNIQINASFPLDQSKTTSVSSDFMFSAGDILEVQATTTGFAPLVNTANLNIIIKI